MFGASLRFEKTSSSSPLLDTLRTLENFPEKEFSLIVGKRIGDSHNASPVANRLQHLLDLVVPFHQSSSAEAPSGNLNSSSFSTARRTVLRWKIIRRPQSVMSTARFPQRAKLRFFFAPFFI
jgi:hypothetical protein